MIFTDPKKLLYNNEITVINSSLIDIPGVPMPNIPFINESLQLPLPASIDWHRSVPINEAINYTESIPSVDLSVTTAKRVFGVKSAPFPKMSSNPRILRFEFLVKNKLKNPATGKYTIDKVEEFFSKRSIDTKFEHKYRIKIIKFINYIQTVVMEFENYKLHEVTVNRAPFKIVDSKAFSLRLTFIEASPPKDNAFF